MRSEGNNFCAVQYPKLNRELSDFQKLFLEAMRQLIGIILWDNKIKSMHVQMLEKVVLSKGKCWKNLLFKKIFCDITVAVDIPLCQNHISCMQVEERRGKNNNKEQIFLTSI